MAERWRASVQFEDDPLFNWWSFSIYDATRPGWYCTWHGYADAGAAHIAMRGWLAKYRALRKE